MAKPVFLLLSVFIPYVFTQCTVEKSVPGFRRSVYDFSIELLSRLAQEKDNHFVASTLSTWVILSCTSLGASDSTLKELREVLRLHSLKCYNNNYLKLANTVAVNNETDVVLERSSTMFVDDQMPINEEFKRRVISTGVSTFESLQFDDPEAAAQRINEYVSRATHDVIDEVVAAGDLDDVLLILIDAIFFKGTWKTPFPNENTEVTEFYNDKEAKIGNTNSMYIQAPFNYRPMKLINASVVEIPYGDGERYSMLVFLPFSGISVYTVIDKLKHVSLKTIEVLLKEYEPQKVALQIPRFKITSDISNLKELLDDMGLKTMFDSTRAQFTRLSDYPLYVSNIFQKADIEVTEEGTVAAAVTVEEFTFRSMPAEFRVNKPFLFMIVDKKVEVPLFVGAYSKPSIY